MAFQQITLIWKLATPDSIRKGVDVAPGLEKAVVNSRHFTFKMFSPAHLSHSLSRQFWMYPAPYLTATLAFPVRRCVNALEKSLQGPHSARKATVRTHEHTER
jgi:hypothetical protein